MTTDGLIAQQFGNPLIIKGQQKLKWGADIKKFLTHKNYPRLAENRKEWNRLQEIFALYGLGLVAT